MGSTVSACNQQRRRTQRLIYENLPNESGHVIEHKLRTEIAQGPATTDSRMDSLLPDAWLLR
ncbi:MAG: hypothetical protein HXS41_15710 [Theionarchaea archaeon]|nr:hypothetical protein [Theionarchaea archaeon]